MQIVIDIPDGCYEELCNASFPVQEAYRLVGWIKDGTPLPKGHGRLIDINDLLDDIGLEDCGENRDCNMGEIITLENIDRIPTIIEAEEDAE